MRPDDPRCSQLKNCIQVKARFPLCRTDDVLAGFMVEDDGRVNPVDATMVAISD